MSIDVTTVSVPITVSASGTKVEATVSGGIGPAGTAATITVGTVTTGAAGSSATVVNSGTASAAVLNFTIPAGATGPQGPVGPPGTTTWAGITDKPATFAPAAHTHTPAEVGLGNVENTSDASKPVSTAQAAADAAVASAAAADATSKANAAQAHAIQRANHTGTQAISTVTGLQAALDGKQAAGSYAATVHGHTISDVTGLQAALDAKATPADVTAAVTAVIDAAPAALDTLNELAAALGDDANFASTVTTALAGKAAAVHSHGISDVTGLQTALDGKAAATHTHTSSEVGLGNVPNVNATQRSSHTGSQTASTISDFTTAAAAAAPVQSVAGKTGTVTLAKGDVGLGNVDNTSDANKPVSSATQTALNGKAAAVHTHAIADVTSLQTQLDYRVSSAVPFTENHTDARGSQYQAGDLVHVGGNVWRAIATNDAIVPGSSGAENYWVYVGPGYRLNIDILDIANHWLPPATATDGYVLAWNATNGAWEASAIPTELPSGSAGQLLGHDGTAWVATSLPTASDTVLGAVKIGSGVTITDGVISVSTNYAAATHTHVAADITDFTTEAAAAAPVQSVAGQTGAVTLAKGDVGLGNVDNTSDADKPVSTATQTALDAKAAASHSHSWNDITTGTPTTLAGYGITDAVSSLDSRLTDARTPTAHKTTHATGGSDALTPTDIGAAAASHTHIPGDVGLGNVPNVDATSRANHTGTQAISTVSGLQTALDGKAAATHGHAIADVTGLQTALDGKQAAGSYAAASHGHVIGDVTGLQTALDGKQAAGSYAAATHGHAIADVTGLQSALDGKQTAGSYAAATHTHAAADITSGTIADARLPIATVAQSVAGTSASTLVTPHSMHLSRRGSGRSKFFELFTDFAMTASGISEGSDGFLWGRHVSGTGADCNTYSNRFLSFSRPGAGILSMITGTTATGRAGIDSWNDNSIFRFDQGTTTFETLIYIPTLATATDDYVLRLGFVQGNALTNDVIAFEYNRSNSVNWHGVTGWNGGYTRVDTGVAVAATKWLLLALEFTSTSLTLRINGTACGTITSNIRPDGGTRLGTHLLKTAGTTSVTVLLDYVYYRHDFNSDRTFTP